MNKNVLFVLALLLSCATMLQAQDKGEQVNHIRKVYADAKKRIAENGKNGTAALDVTVTSRDATEVSEDFSIESICRQQTYFSKVPTSDGYFENVPYFISTSSESNGHTMYREFLYDPQKGYLLFSYMKGETHAGFEVETRYYYDANGGLVDQKHRVAGSDATADAHSWNSWDTDLEMGKQMLQQFRDLMEREDANGMTKGTKLLKTTKADRMKMIRGQYAKAKNNIARIEKSDFATGVDVVIHDQHDIEGPPLTKTYKFYFDYTPDSEGNPAPHCYFFSERHKSMYMESYEEFLFDPKTDDLIFFYDTSEEEDMHFEVRLYYDANGHCIESKHNTDIDDFDFYCDSQRSKARKMLKVFRSAFL